MTKIYQTKEDYQKDVLKDQAKDLHLKSERQSASGMGWIAISAIAQGWFERHPVKYPGLAMFATAITCWVGFFSVIKSWFTGNKAHDLELQRERLGPETMILPPDAIPAPAEQDCGCKAKRFSAALAPATFTDLAAKSDASPARE